MQAFPNGTAKKFKACFCAHGDQQLERIDFFETYATVVQRTNVCLMLILRIYLPWNQSKLMSLLPFFVLVLVKMKLFMWRCLFVSNSCSSNGKFKVLCLKKTLYGLHQSPHAFWKYLTESLGNCGLPQVPFDPCLSIGKRVIAFCYIDSWSSGQELKMILLR